MNRQRFNEQLEEAFNSLRELTSTKGIEYASDEDAFADFHDVAKELGMTPVKALMTYATKHWRAINSYTRTGRVFSEPIQGRIDDLILYMHLLRAMITEEEKREDLAQTTSESAGSVTMMGDAELKRMSL